VTSADIAPEANPLQSLRHSFCVSFFYYISSKSNKAVIQLKHIDPTEATVKWQSNDHTRSIGWRHVRVDMQLPTVYQLQFEMKLSQSAVALNQFRIQAGHCAHLNAEDKHISCDFENGPCLLHAAVNHVNGFQLITADKLFGHITVDHTHFGRSRVRCESAHRINSQFRITLEIFRTKRSIFAAFLGQRQSSLSSATAVE
jgi:hypothetical protein